MNHSSNRSHSRRSRQQGAALYVALIMLILLALIGIVGMQVAGLQERMAANYRTTNMAFQNAEALARTTECGLERLEQVPDVPVGHCAIVSRSEIADCRTDGFDVGVWVSARVLANAPARNIRELTYCVPYFAEAGMGDTQEEGAGPLPIYQITTYQTDTDGAANPSSAAAVDTIFKL